jgi:hypothetical protein
MSPQSLDRRLPTLRGRGSGRGKYIGPPVVDGRSAVDDVFARCESACRTGSESLVHENAHIYAAGIIASGTRLLHSIGDRLTEVLDLSDQFVGKARDHLAIQRCNWHITRIW